MAYDQDVPPVREEADHSPAQSLWRFVRLMSGKRQIGLAALAVASAGLTLVPIDLQRRIVDDAIAAGDAEALFRLAAVYAAAVIALQGSKYALRVWQGAVAERTAAYTRNHLYFLYRRNRGDRGGQAGEAVSILNAEVDKLAGFVGAGPSDAIASAATLAGVIGYMFWVEPMIAAIGLGLLVPQAVVAQLVQRRLNRLTERRVELLRKLGDVVSEAGGSREAVGTRVERIRRNRLSFVRLKSMMKAALNLLDNAAPLGVLVFGGWMAIRGETTVGVLVAFISGFDRLSAPIRDLLAAYRDAAQANVHHSMIARWMRDVSP